MKKVKNVDSIVHTWCGQEIQPNTYYELQSNEIVNWANDSDFLHALVDSLAYMNDGSLDITDPANGINFLKDITILDSDGAAQTRLKIATLGSKYLGDCFEFKTSDLDSKYHRDAAGNNLTYTTLKLYDADGLEITDAQYESNAIKTIVDWEYPTDYEIIGGCAYINERPIVDVRCWAIGVPDIPAQYGGSVEFLRNLNFKILQSQKFNHDGRVPKMMHYSEQHTNKFRFIITHPAGHVSEIMIEVQIFRP